MWGWPAPWAWRWEEGAGLDEPHGPGEDLAPAAVDAVRRAARENGVKVESTEMVGMAPLSALLEAARHQLALPRLGPEDVLEAAIWESGPDAPGEE
jgi:hypothetical protein